MRPLAALLPLLAVAAAVAVVVLTVQSHVPTVELAGGGSQGPLISKLRTLLAEKSAEKQAREQQLQEQPAEENAHAELAAAAAKWKSARSDWMPYNPSLSLTQNKLARQAAGDARQTELNEQAIVNKLAVHGNHHAAPHRPHMRAGLERYQADMYARAPKKACSDWGAHPIDCIRAAFGNHLKGTKFAKLRRRYDGRVTESALDHERNLISKKVSEGLIKGNIKPPKHDKAVTSWLHRVKAQMRAARKLAMQRALAARITSQELHAHESKVAKEWGSGVVASGPEAGRRYYTDFATGKTSFDAPRYVQKALRDVRLRHKAKAEHAVQREAKLYEEGFRAAQRAILLKEGRTTSLSEVPTTSLVGKRRLEQIHAEKAINNFLTHGGRHPKANKYTWKDLATEREKIAHELGYKSLTHEDGRLSLTQREGVEQQLHSQQKIIVDAYGHPLTHRPTAEDYPMGSGDYAQPETAAPAAAHVPSNTEAAAATESTDTQMAVAKAVEKVASAVKQKTDALQSEVSAQQAIINDLEHKVAQQTRASVRTAATTQARGRDAESKPKLGSFEMAKFANNLGTGTSIVDVYDDLKSKADYAGVANRGGQLRSSKDFAAVRNEVERQVRGQAVSAEARKVAQDIAKVSHEAKQVGGPAVATQALAAVKHAMKAEEEHVYTHAPTHTPFTPFPFTFLFDATVDALFSLGIRNMRSI